MSIKVMIIASLRKIGLDAADLGQFLATHTDGDWNVGVAYSVSGVRALKMMVGLML